jgi:hypothetical protein
MPVAPDSRVGARLEALVDAIGELVRTIEPACVTGPDAARLAETYARGEKLCAAGKADMAARASQTAAWEKQGTHSAAEWLAGLSGTSIREAAEEMETAERISTQPEVSEAVRSGRISSNQAHHISKAVAKDPDSASRLLDIADKGSDKGLRKACRSVSMAAQSQEEDQVKARRLHQSRYLRTWVDDEGAGRIQASLAPDAFAKFIAGLAPFRAQVFAAARQAGIRESSDAYAADALVAMAMAAQGGEGGLPKQADEQGAHSSGPVASPAGASFPDGDRMDAPTAPGGGASPRRRGPPGTVIAVIDISALRAGHARPDQRCEIDGIGPVPVSTVMGMVADSLLAAVVTDGVDIQKVVHLGRYATAHQRTALMVRDPVCVVPGCEVSVGLEIDHVDGWSETHATKLDRLARLCHHHHAKKTYEGWTLTGAPGCWEWHPPPPGPFDDEILAAQRYADAACSAPESRPTAARGGANRVCASSA